MDPMHRPHPTGAQGVTVTQLADPLLSAPTMAATVLDDEARGSRVAQPGAGSEGIVEVGIDRIGRV